MGGLCLKHYKISNVSFHVSPSEAYHHATYWGKVKLWTDISNNSLTPQPKSRGLPILYLSLQKNRTLILRRYFMRR